MRAVVAVVGRDMVATWTYVPNDGTVEKFQSPEELDDPFNEHPYGKIKVSVMPTEFCFPTFDPDDRVPYAQIPYSGRVPEPAVYGRAI